MKLNNKGVTLVEIIISIALISIVLIFLFSLLISVKDLNNNSQTNSTYLINKSLIIKTIEDDILKNNSEEILVSGCDIQNAIYDEYTSESDNSLNANECLRLNFQSEDNPDYAYLALYYYKVKENFVITYKHDNVIISRELPNFVKNNVYSGNIKNKLLIKNSNSECDYSSIGSCSFSNIGFYKIEIPIIGDDDKDYTIIISYYGIIRSE